MRHGVAKAAAGPAPEESKRSAVPVQERADAPIAARLIELHTIESATRNAYGAITEITGGEACPFDFKRVYWIYGARAGEIRGRHAHRTLSQLMVAVAGTFEITVSDGRQSETFRLDSPRRGLLLEPGYWRIIRVVDAASVLLVAASAPFEEADYIRNYAAFKAYRKSLRTAPDGEPG